MIELDETDSEVLTLLAENARLSVRELGRRLGKSPGAIADRVARLEQSGVIRGYHADIDAAALGYGLEAILTLDIEHEAPAEETLHALMQIAEVEAAAIITGRVDIIMRLRVRDTVHLRNVVLEEIWKLPGLRQIETMISFETRQRAGGYNVGLLLGRIASSDTANSQPRAAMAAAEESINLSRQGGRRKKPPRQI